MCAFPLHLWTLILFFNDYAWVAERTNAWDAIGVGAYGLVFAFLESVLVFLGAVVLGLLIPRKWDEDQRTALISVLVLITSFWAMIGQLYFLVNIRVTLPAAVALWLVQSGHPVRFLYLGAAVLIGLTVLPTTLLILRSRQAVAFVMASIDRISLLVMFYLFFDFVGVIIVILRNLG